MDYYINFAWNSDRKEKGYGFRDPILLKKYCNCGNHE